MLVYTKTKRDFMNDLIRDQIVEEVDQKVFQILGRHTPVSEKRAWRNSLDAMYKVLNISKVPDQAGVAIEYNIPQTSKRIDLLLSGYDQEDQPNAVIIELKQWEKIHKVEGMDALIETFINKGNHRLVHPSYQASSYAALIRDFNESIEKDKVNLSPCAYLHNYRRIPNDPIDDPIYDRYTREAPVFTSGQAETLAKYLNQLLCKGDNQAILNAIENGKFRPSKRLQDEVGKMIHGNESFTLIDDQKVVFESILEIIKSSCKKREKNTIIIQGGPGTGKSVVAIHLLCQCIQDALNTRYVTKNSAPRDVYSLKLDRKGSCSSKNLFCSSGQFTDPVKNLYDVLIVDEAHRLVEKGMYVKEGNQIAEIIHNSLVNIFFIDENQQVVFKDFGSVSEIEKQADIKESDVIHMKLKSQFRCNGSDGYLSWLDDVLQIQETGNYSLEGIDYDIQILNSPQEVLACLKARQADGKTAMLTAGYCWNWIKEGKSDPNVKDIEIGDFKISWNLNAKDPFVVRNSLEECGCIHTVQGLEYDYAGVIIGDDLRYENGKIITDPSRRAKTDTSLNGWKKAMKENPIETEARVDRLIKNTYRTLMSRGMKGCFVYCTDQNLADYLKQRLNLISFI